MSLIWIMRGLPGSGKTTYVKENQAFDPTLYFSADLWHTVNGVYRFDPKRAGEAHAKCLRGYLLALMIASQSPPKEVLPDIFVDNTNTTLAELAPYVRAAEAFDREYKVIYMLCDVATSIRRNIHMVPANTILTMHKNLENELIPPYWNQEIIVL